MTLLDLPIWFQVPEAVGELGVSLRGLIHKVLAVEEVSPELAEKMRDVGRRVDALSEELNDHALEDRFPRMAFDEEKGARPYYVQGGMIGDHHPFVPTAEIKSEGGRTWGKVYFDVAFEGPPGCVHGGFISFFFDQILGHHNLANDIPAMTGTLTVRYNKPTPLKTELEFEVFTEKVESRKVLDRAYLKVDGEKICEAEGIFLLPRESGFMAR